MFTASGLQAATYLLCVCLFSISFLVFLNSSLSFVITDLIGTHDGVGNAVGTLGFADELVALVACPVWGLLSDRVGVRTVGGSVIPCNQILTSSQVCIVGYSIIGLSLFVLVQAKNVYPQLLFARLFFSIGGAAAVTMVTAILPSMTAPDTEAGDLNEEQSNPIDHINGHTEAPSISSELTITPVRLGRPTPQRSNKSKSRTESASPTRLAGIVGMFTGCGALVALGVFLRLPTKFRGPDVDAGQALADTYYVVGGIALSIALCCFFGLKNLNGEEGRSWRAAFQRRSSEGENLDSHKIMSYRTLLLDSLRLGVQNHLIGLGYLGAFVARASSVGITLFIPLYVNHYFTASGICKIDDPDNAKEQCHEAYVLAAKLTGTSQLVALLCAPAFGYLADRYQRYHLPLMAAAICGIAGYASFAALKSPESGGKSGSPWIFVVAALLGISQIGCIVCSLGLLGRGISGLEDGTCSDPVLDSAGDRILPRNDDDNDDDHEGRSLLTGRRLATRSRTQLKGSIAGVYSLTGGIGILLLTKLGGFLFDAKAPTSPFYMLCTFNGLLLVVLMLRGILEALQDYRKESVE